MGDFHASTTVDAGRHELFGCLSDVSNLHFFFARMAAAEPGEGEEVRTTAELPNGRQVEGHPGRRR